MLLSCWSQRKWWSKRFFGPEYLEGQSADNSSTTKPVRKESFLTDKEKSFINLFLEHFNQPLNLLVMGFPALVSLALLPIFFFLYPTMVACFWPTELFAVPPKVNDAISCFLMPAGLVYAIAFGFAFQGAMCKQQGMNDKVTSIVLHIQQIIMVVSLCTDLTDQDKTGIYMELKQKVLQWMNVVIQAGRVEESKCKTSN